MCFAASIMEGSMVEAHAGFTALQNHYAAAKSVAKSAAKSLLVGVENLLLNVLKPKVYAPESYTVTVTVSETTKQDPPEKALLPQPVLQHARNEIVVQMSTIPQSIERTVISNPPAEVNVERPVAPVPLLTMYGQHRVGGGETRIATLYVPFERSDFKLLEMQGTSRYYIHEALTSAQI